MVLSDLVEGNADRRVMIWAMAVLISERRWVEGVGDFGVIGVEMGDLAVVSWCVGGREVGGDIFGCFWVADWQG